MPHLRWAKQWKIADHELLKLGQLDTIHPSPDPFLWCPLSQWKGRHPVRRKGTPHYNILIIHTLKLEL
jgi:hypothetical protein